MPFVSVDNVQLDYEIRGSGAPLVVYLHGNGMPSSIAWRDVHPLLRDLGTCLSYDRPGVGASGKPRAPQTGSANATTLRAVLGQLALPPPYVLVGHSSGGIYADFYARMFPDEVAGVAFVESAHPAQLEAFKPRMSFAMRVQLWIATRNRNIEMASYADLQYEKDYARPFPEIPIVVITGAKPDPRLLALMEPKLALQKELAALSPKSTHLTSHESGHMIPHTEPQLVADAIRELCTAAS